MKKQTEKKSNKSKDLKNIPVPHKLDIPRYTYEVWKETYMEKVKEWSVQTMPLCLYDFVIDSGEKVIQMLDLKASDNMPKLRIVVLDDEYLAWLKKNEIENTTEARSKYMKTVSDEKAIRLLRKNDWGSDIELLGIPVCVVSPKPEDGYTSYVLTEEVRKKLHAYLTKLYGKGNVFLTKYVLKAEEYYNHGAEFLIMAKSYYKTGANISGELEKWEKQSCKNEDMKFFTLIIPYAVNRKYASATFDIDKIKMSSNPLYDPELIFTKEETHLYGIKHVEDFEGSILEKQIIKCMGGNAVIYPYSISLYQIPQELERFFDATAEKEIIYE